MSIILAIESSCDETACALYDTQRDKLLANHIYSQIALHAPYGGVVPELASRDHIRKLIPLIDQALSTSGLRPDQLSGVAYTRGPGLIGALMVGATVARSLAFAWSLPSLGVHHLEAHLMAVMLEDSKPDWPFTALLVSGGHTLLVRVLGLGRYVVLGQTVDDAVGEAFDKTAKCLGLSYPGGPALSALAETGDPSRFAFPRPMLNQKNCDFSFSGLKTHTASCWKKNQTDDDRENEMLKRDIATAFECAAVDVLLKKTARALEQTGDTRLVVAGGVSANKRLRLAFKTYFSEAGCDVYYPRYAFCTDNAAMVAMAAAMRMSEGECDEGGLQVKSRWSLESLRPPEEG